MFRHEMCFFKRGSIYLLGLGEDGVVVVFVLCSIMVPVTKSGLILPP